MLNDLWRARADRRRAMIADHRRAIVGRANLTDRHAAISGPMTVDLEMIVDQETTADRAKIVAHATIAAMAVVQMVRHAATTIVREIRTTVRKAHLRRGRN